MGTTSLGFHYPDADAEPDGAGQMYQLAEDLDAWLALRNSDWADFNAAPNFTTGSGGGGFTRWRYESGNVHVNGRLIFGTNPFVDPSAMTFNLPTAASALRGIPFASRVAFVDAGGGTFVGDVVIKDRFSAQLYCLNLANGHVLYEPATRTTPFTPGLNDYIDIDFSYSVDGIN